MPEKNHYETLGVEEDSPLETIKAAYRKLALKFHPDKNPGNTANTEQFQNIATAYGILSDPEKRKRYDKELRDAEEVDAFEIVEENESSASNNALMMVKTYRFGEVVIGANPTRKELFELAHKDLTLAKTIVETPELLEILGYIRFLDLAEKYEEIAEIFLKKQFREPEPAFYSFSANDEYGLWVLAKKHSIICQLILQDSQLSSRLNIQQLLELRTQYADDQAVQTAFENNEEVSARYNAYRELHAYLDEAADTRVMDTAKLETLFYEAKLTPELLEHLAKEKLIVARLIFESPKLYNSLTFLELFRIALKHKEIAVNFVRNKALWLSCAQDSLGMSTVISYSAIFTLARKYSEACLLLLTNEELSHSVSGKEWHRLRLHYEQNSQITIALNSNQSVATMLNAYEQLLTVATKGNFVTVSELQNHCRTANLRGNELKTLAKKSFAIAQAILSDNELEKVLGYHRRELYLSHKEIALTLDDKAITAAYFFHEDDFYTMAATWIEVCQLILAKPKLLAKLSGKHLYDLTVQYGLKIDLADEEPLKRLRSYALIDIASKNPAGMRLHKRATASLQKEEHRENLYQMAKIYQRQNTRESLELAGDYYYRAAVLGHGDALPPFVEMVQATPNSINQIKVAEVYVRQGKMEEARAWRALARASLQLAEINPLAEHITRCLGNLKDDFCSELVGAFYLEAMVFLTELPQFNDVEKIPIYHSLSHCLEQCNESQLALTALLNIPDLLRSEDDLLRMGNLALTATADRQLIEQLQQFDNSESESALLRSPQNLAERYKNALPYYLTAAARGFASAKRLSINMLREFFNLDLPMDEIGSLVLQEQTMIENFSLVLNDEEIRKNHGQMFLQLALKNSTIAAHLLSFLSFAEITAHLTDTYLLSLLQQHPTLIGENSVVQRVIPHIKDAETYYQIGLLCLQQNQKKSALSFFSKAAEFEHQNARLFTKYSALTEDSFVFDALQLMMDKNLLSWLPVFETIYQLPQLYQKVRQQFLELLKKDEYSATVEEDFVATVATLETISQQMDTQKKAINAFLSQQEQLVIRFQKDSQRYWQQGLKTEARKSSTKSMIVQNLITKLQMDVKHYYSQDFSSIAPDDAAFSQRLKTTIREQLIEPNAELKEQASWAKQLAFSLLCALRKIFPTSATLSVWMTNVSAHFKVITENEATALLSNAADCFIAPVVVT